jgi:hypothetical protein
MKLNGRMLVVVAMMVGSLGAMGCKSTDTGSEAVAPEETPDTAPTATASATPGVEMDERRVHFYARVAPPAARWEERGRAPSERHFWAPGYYRWSGREHVWYNGRWERQREGYVYVSPHWQQDRFGRWEYISGYWARR